MNFLYKLLLGGIYTGLCCLLFLPAFNQMVRQWNQEDFNYCYIVPLVVLYLIWERRRGWLAAQANPSWKGLLPLSFGIFLFWLGELGGEFYTLYLSSWLLLVGLLMIAFGWSKLKTMRFPLFFVIMMFPPPNVIYSNLSLNLKLLSSQMGVQILQLLGMPAYREGNVIDLGFTRLQVVDACSGLRYLFPLLALGILIAYHFKAKWWKRGVLVISTVPLTVITNSMRIASVGLLHPVFGPQVAEGFFHDFSGWLIFMVSVALLMVEMCLLRILFPEEAVMEADMREPAHAARQSSTPRVLILQSIAFLVLAATAVTAKTVDFREKVALSRPFLEFPLSIDEWEGRRQALEEQYLNALHLSDYILADYSNKRGETVNLYVAYNESQRKGASSHSPATCLPGNGWVFEESGAVDIRMNKTRFQVQRAIMRNGGDQMLVYYWFPQRGRILTSMVQLKIYAFWDALVSRRSDGALVRLITPISGGETATVAEARLNRFASSTIPLLNAFLPGN